MRIDTSIFDESPEKLHLSSKSKVMPKQINKEPEVIVVMESNINEDKVKKDLCLICSNKRNRGHYYGAKVSKVCNAIKKITNVMNMITA
jgi:hypothetical protein